MILELRKKLVSLNKAFTLEQYTNGLIIKLNDIQNKFTFQVKEDISEFAITDNLKKIDHNSIYKITKIERNMLSGFSINVDFLYKDRVIFGKKYELSGFKQLKDNVFSIVGHNDFWNYAIDELDTAFLGTFLPDYKAVISDAQKDDKEGKITFNFLVTSQDGNTKYAEVKNLTLNSLVLPEYDKDHKVLVQWKYSRTTVVRDKFLANITKIGEKAFEGKTIESIVLPSTLVEIGEKAFLNCTKINNFDLIIPNTATKLGNDLFVGAHIKSVTLPSNLTSLPSDTFKSAVINILTLSDTIETINSNAFNEAKINKLVLSKALKEIPTDAFNGIQLSEGLVIPDKVTNIKDGAFRNSKLKSITLPASVTSIGKNVFQGVTFSGDVTIPATIKTIESGAFLNASVKNLVFDKTLEDIKNGAFSGIKIEGKITLPAKFNDKDKLKAIGIADADIAKCVFI